MGVVRVMLGLENFATASRRCIGMINRLVDCQLVDYTDDTPILRFVLDLSYKLFLHCHAAVGKILTDTSRSPVRHGVYVSVLALFRVSMSCSVSVSLS